MVTLLRDHAAVTRQTLFEALAAASHPARGRAPKTVAVRILPELLRTEPGNRL